MNYSLFSISEHELENLNETLRGPRSFNQLSKANKINQSRKQIIKMLLVIIILFTTCWFPRLVKSSLGR